MYILNDYSIDGQFEDIEIFLDSLIDHTIPLLIIMDNYKLDLLKSYEMYNLKITKDISIFDLLNKRNYPEIVRFKSLLNKILYDNPYWEKEDINQNCITEAFKRSTGLISFEHEEYLSDRVEYLHEGILQMIPNSYNKIQLLEELREKGTIGVGEYLEKKFPVIQSFCNVDVKNYFEDFIKDNNIKQDEVDKIIKDLNDFMNKYLSKKDMGRLSKTIGTNLYEFRTTIADAKEVRILYCLNKSRLVFLNCFIKKQQKTPEGEKALARRLRDGMIAKN